MLKNIKFHCNRCGNIQDISYNSKRISDIQICKNCGKVDIPLYEIPLSYFNIDRIVSILENELLRRKLDDPIGVIYIWKDKEEKEHKLHKMSSEYIQNIIGMIKRKYGE